LVIGEQNHQDEMILSRLQDCVQCKTG